MPIYEYYCADCGLDFEVMRSVSQSESRPIARNAAIRPNGNYPTSLSSPTPSHPPSSKRLWRSLCATETTNPPRIPVKRKNPQALGLSHEPPLAFLAEALASPQMMQGQAARSTL